MTTRTKNFMWTKEELYKAMQKAGWQPGTVDGLFVHRQTNRHIDMMSRNRFGILWIQYAEARETPAPFG